MRILITGGHFSPAYALISELMVRKHTVAIAGRRHPFEGDLTESYEYTVAARENIPFFEIKTGRFQRKFTTYTISSLFRTPIGFLRAYAIFAKFKPDVVLTFGGYIGLPLAAAAPLFGVPVILHEQTQSAGLAARLIGRIAKKICISFEGSEKYFPKNKVVFTGNPVRREIFEVADKLDLPESKAVIYITGGSTGSHFINLRILEIAGELLSDFVLIHQTGDSLKFNDFERLADFRKGLPLEKKKRYILRKFIEEKDIGFVFEKADLILSRAGINTVCEILAMRKVALLIPLAHGQAGEQLENAKLVHEIGVGDYIEEDEATGAKILTRVRFILGNIQNYQENIKKGEKYMVRDAAKRIVNIIENIKRGKN